MKKRKAATDPPPPPPFSQEEVIAAALAGDVEQLRAYMDAPSARRSKRGRWLDAAHSGGCCGLRPLDAAVLSNSPAAIKLLAEHVMSASQRHLVSSKPSCGSHSKMCQRPRGTR